MAATFAVRPQRPPTFKQQMPPPHTHNQNCPKCGTPVIPPSQLQDSQRIAELESQVRILTDKATAAADKLADYEDEIRRIRASQNTPSRSNTSDSLAPSRPSEEAPRPTTANSTSGKTSRFSFLTNRRGSPAPQTFDAPRPSESDLKAQLEKEQELRQTAETKLQKLNVEIEDLSVQLFSQANEMVAEERKARTKLEERVAVLERRDEEKRTRLERLEEAMKRIDRVRNLLSAS